MSNGPRRSLPIRLDVQNMSGLVLCIRLVGLLSVQFGDEIQVGVGIRFGFALVIKRQLPCVVWIAKNYAETLKS